MTRGNKVQVSDLQEGKTYLLSHGMGNSAEVTYTGTAMGQVWIIPIPWSTVYVFSEDGETHKMPKQQVQDNVYHKVDDA